jgi:hypothetical protein
MNIAGGIYFILFFLVLNGNIFLRIARQGHARLIMVALGTYFMSNENDLHFLSAAFNGRIASLFS